jgi:hypothetical protein
MKVADLGRLIIFRLTGDPGMKLKLVLLSFLLVSVALAQNYVSPLRFTRPNRSNLLTWTNRVCAKVPVYQVLRSTNLATTNWQHFLYVTNATSTAFSPLPGRITGCSESTFYKLRWLSDTPMIFSYEFDEGYGLGPCVSGTLTISLANLPNAGTWSFQEDGFCLDGDHPTGNGNFFGMFDNYTVSPHHVRLYLSQGPEASYLDAYLQSTVVNGTCRYTSMTGVFVQGGIVGNELGTFTANRTQ